MAFSEKYVTVTGGGLHDGSSEANAWTLAEGVANYAAGDRVNVKAGTYTASSAITWSTSGGQYTPVHWRGYKTSIGDMDDAPTTQRVDGTDIPLFDNSDRFSISCSNLAFSNISFESSFTAAGVQNDTSAQNVHFFRCRFLTDSTSTTARSFLTRGDYNTLVACYFEAPSTAEAPVYIFSGSNRTTILDCFITGGATGMKFSSGTSATVCNTIITNSGTNSVYLDGTPPAKFLNCVFHDAGGDLFSAGNATGAPTCFIVNSVFSDAGGYAINQNTGSETPFIMLSGNLYHDSSFTSGRTNNIVYDLYPTVDTASPFVDAASNDFTLSSSSNGYGKRLLVENVDLSSYRDSGAIQHQDPSGGGGATVHPLRSN
jgi:hypothetical protein